MKLMTIGVDLRPLQTGHRFRGVGRYCYSMVKALEEVDKENDYFLFCGRGLPKFSKIKKEFEGGNFKVEKLLIPTSKWLEILFFKDRLRIPLEALRKKLDIFYSCNWPFLLVNRPIDCKFLITIYGLNPYPLNIKSQRDFIRSINLKEKRSLKGKIGSRILELNDYLYIMSLKKRINQVSHIIVSSENSREDLSRIFGIPSSKISVVYEGIDSKIFRTIRDKKKSERIKRKYGINYPFILFVSAVDWKKNIVNVLEAFKIADRGFRESHQFVFAGSYLKENNKPTNQFLFFKKRVKELKVEDKVVFTGYVPDEELVLLYNAAEICVLPSFYEGFPLTAIEAMACGTPVIASNTSSMPEIIGNAGIYFNPYNISNIAEVMIKVCNDLNLRKKLADGGLKQVKEFSWKKSAKQIIEVFKLLIREGR